MRTDAGRAMLAILTIATGMAVACGKAAPARRSSDRGVRHRRRPEGRSRLPRTGRTDRRDSQDVEIRARVEGFLETVNFREGSFVRKGALLYQIDRKPLEALSARRARPIRRPPQARLEKAKNDVSALYAARRRSRRSASRSWTTRRPRRTRRRAQVDAAKAALDKATLDLSYTRDHGADRRARRHHAGEAGQPRRPRREHAADDDLAGQSDPLPRGVTEADYLRDRQARSDGEHRRGAERRPAST